MINSKPSDGFKDTRKRYKCECPCGNTFWACKSILQQNFGSPELGSGSCPKCKVYYNLTVDEENECMKLTKWDDYIEKRKKESEAENDR